MIPTRYTNMMAGALALLAMQSGCKPAAANPVCAPLKDMLESMAKEYQETPVSIGIYSDGTILVVLASKDGRTWTQLCSGRTGQTCAVASGTDWQPGTLPEAEGPKT